MDSKSLQVLISRNTSQHRRSRETKGAIVKLRFCILIRSGSCFLTLQNDYCVASETTVRQGCCSTVGFSSSTVNANLHISSWPLSHAIGRHTSSLKIEEFLDLSLCPQIVFTCALARNPLKKASGLKSHKVREHQYSPVSTQLDQWLPTAITRHNQAIHAEKTLKPSSIQTLLCDMKLA